MKYIQLTKNKQAIVDDEDFDYLNQFKWSCDSYGYAVRHIKRSERGNTPRRMIKMHRVINNTPTGMETDHIDRNKLNNQKINLRSVTTSQNQHNAKIATTNTSGFRGVYWDKKYNRWCARAYIMGKSKFGGGFKSKSDAVKAYENIVGEIF